jgi:hypothetical protein
MAPARSRITIILFELKPAGGRTAGTWIFSHVSHDGKLFVSAADIQATTAALEAALMEQEQHYPCSVVVLP